MAIPGFGGSSQVEWNKQRALYRQLSDRESSLRSIESRLENHSNPEFGRAVRLLCHALANETMGPSHATRRLLLFSLLSLILIVSWLGMFGWEPPSQPETHILKSLGSLGLVQLAGLLWLSTMLGVVFRTARRLIDRASYLIAITDLSRDFLMGILLAFGYLLLCLAGTGI